MAGVQARLTIPVLLVTLAVTPPFLLQMAPLDLTLGPRGPGRTPQLPPWQVSRQQGMRSAESVPPRQATA